MEYPNSVPDNPLVSVCIQTYNHAPYIVQCIEGALMQETDFPFEIIIGEDESTDGTREICIEYAKRYPEKIRLFLRSRKDVVYINGRPTGQFNYQSNLKSVRGKFIAICEGDDFWDSPKKLQKQVDFLNAYPSLSGCFHNARTVDKDSELIKSDYYIPGKKKYTQFECLTELISSYATCTLMYRSEVLKAPWPKWFKRRTCDETVDILITGYGDLGYLPENMAAYRIHKGGIWQGSKNVDNLKDLFFRAQVMFEDKEFNPGYKPHLRIRLRNHAKLIANRSPSKRDKLKFYYYYLRYTDFLLIVKQRLQKIALKCAV